MDFPLTKKIRILPYGQNTRVPGSRVLYCLHEKTGGRSQTGHPTSAVNLVTIAIRVFFFFF